MQRILLTGMSGVGKSTVAERLSELGYKVVETDYGDYSVVDERGYQHWDVDRVRELLATEDADVLFVVGSDDAQVLFYPDFDQISPSHPAVTARPGQPPYGLVHYACSIEEAVATEYSDDEMPVYRRWKPSSGDATA